MHEKTGFCKELSVWNRFNTAAGIAHQFSANKGTSLSRHTVPHSLSRFGLKAHSAVTKPVASRKNKKARLAFTEVDVMWTEENWSGVNFSDEVQ